MNKNFVNWKPVIFKNLYGKNFPFIIPETIDIRNRGTLLAKILTMQKKDPISFEGAIRKVLEKRREAFRAGRFGDKPEQYGYYDLYFVEWISSLGFHIELTGDEFEAYVMSDKVA